VFQGAAPAWPVEPVVSLDAHPADIRPAAVIAAATSQCESLTGLELDMAAPPRVDRTLHVTEQYPGAISPEQRLTKRNSAVRDCSRNALLLWSRLTESNR
jgi:hypothetical protein